MTQIWILVLAMLVTASLCDVPQRRHNPGAPLMPTAPPIKPFSLSSACSVEVKTLCDLRSPFGDKAIACLEKNARELSPTCASWHNARMACKREVASADFSSCEECKRFCSGNLSLLHCLRSAGPRLPMLGVTAACTDTDFYRAISKAYRKVHQTS